MIAVSDGAAVERLLRRVASRPGAFRQVVVCAPFIDELSVELLSALARRRSDSAPRISVLTTASVAATLASSAFGGRSDATLDVHDRLHAKVYIVEGYCPSESEVIVTSANLTRSGLRRNVELGVSALPTSRCGAAVFAAARHWLRLLRVEATRKEMSR